MQRWKKVKLSSCVMLLWICLICLLLAAVYLVFTLRLHHYQAHDPEAVRQGIMILEESLALVSVFVVVLFLPVIAIFIRHSVVRPAERLIAAMNSFDAEQYPLLEKDMGTLEFSALASAFNRMVKVLWEHDQQVNILLTAIEQSPAAVVITDLEGKIEYVNSRMEQLTGYMAEELKGRSTSIFQSGYTPIEKYDELWQTVNSGQVWKEELLNKKKDGSLSWEFVLVAPIFSKDKKIINFVATKEDITERKQTRELLRQSEKRYRQTFETNMAVKLIIDPADGALVEANQAAVSYYGYSLEQLVAMRITDINQLSPEEVRAEMVRAEREERLYFNFRHKLASGEIRDVEVYSGPLQSGERTLLYSIIHDVTDRKQAEKQLVAAKKEAESANRAKSVFLANITHELRTPLNAVLGYAQLLGMESTLTAKQLDNVQTIRNAGEYLLMLINDILEFSQIEAGKTDCVSKVFRLPGFFSGVADIIKPEMNAKGLTLQFQEDPQLPEFIRADELRLRQVILNLLSNVVKFTPQGGACLLRSELNIISGEQALLTVSVEDNGLGIPLLMQEKIFEPFCQNDERLQYAEGSGLGLAISRQLVRLMGGELEVKSPAKQDVQPNEHPGTCFFFTVPVEIIEPNQRSAVPRQAVTGYTVHAGDTTKKILIVSGNSSNLAVLDNILSSFGFKVHGVQPDSMLARDLDQFRPDAVLAVLPTACCEEQIVLRKIQEQEGLGQLPVIALADYSVFVALEEEQQEGLYTAHVVKPFSGFDLLSVLAEHLPISLSYDHSTERIESEQKIIPPPEEELRALLVKVRQGDVAGINQQVAGLFAMDAGKYKRFALQVEQLAEDFQLNMIADLIKRYGISQ